jgi:hypothetical protein
MAHRNIQMVYLLKMVDLSMAMLNNQRVYIYILLNWTLIWIHRVCSDSDSHGL